MYDPATDRLRPAYAFVATLSYSRHQYAELVFDQKVSTWIALHRRAFASWGGVPRRIVPDNLKAGVAQALVHDPVLGEAYRRMAQHYGFLISPTKPHTARHKGKVENGVHYLQRNFMAGQPALAAGQGTLRTSMWPMNTWQSGPAIPPGSVTTARPISLHCDCSWSTNKPLFCLFPRTPSRCARSGR